MNIVVNPFLHSIQSEIIVDNIRASRIFSPLIGEGGSLAVFGERGTGKSSLLYYITHPPSDWQREHFSKHIFVSFNCPDTVTPFTPTNFWFQTIKLLNDKVEAGPIKEKCQVLLENYKNGTDLNHSNFHEILDVAAKACRRIVLVLDDFDYLIRIDDEHLNVTRTFLQGLRSLTTRDSNKANLIVATRRSLEELSKPVTVLGISPFSNGFTSYRLRMLREDEVNQLLLRVEKTSQMLFTTKETKYINYLSGYHPKLTMIAAAEIFDQRLEAGAPLEDLTPVGERFKSDARHVFESIWERTNEIEQMLLMLIALQKLEGRIPKRHYDLSDLSVIFSQKERELIELTDRGLLIRTQAGSPKRDFFSPIFGWWVLKEIESADPEELSDYRKVWGYLLTQKQAKKLERLANMARQNIDIIEAFGKAVIFLL